MIVREAPYEVVCLFADADAQRFVEQLLLRGQERGCLREARVRSVRDPKRDVVWRDPLSLLRPSLAQPGKHKVLICWDREGSGRPDTPRAEREVQAKFEQAGFPAQDVCCVCFVPELESLLAPVHMQVLDLIAQIRETITPSESQVLARLRARYRVHASDHADALQRHPKEWLSAALGTVRLKRAPDIYEALAGRLSLPKLKEHALAARVDIALRSWLAPE